MAQEEAELVHVHAVVAAAVDPPDVVEDMAGRKVTDRLLRDPSNAVPDMHPGFGRDLLLPAVAADGGVEVVVAEVVAAACDGAPCQTVAAVHIHPLHQEAVPCTAVGRRLDTDCDHRNAGGA